MKISEVNMNKIVATQSVNKKISTKSVEEVKGDSLQISSVGKSLSAILGEEDLVNSKEKIDSIQRELEKGTYKRDLTLTAKKMIEYARGRENK